MSKEKKIEIIILIFLFVGIITGLCLFVHFKIEKPNTYTITFQDIDSIVKGSPVRFMGMNVGHVIDLKKRDDYILCKIRVTKKDVKLPDGTKAKVAFNGLGGSKSIELMPPLTDDVEVKGIVADNALRIHDFVGVIRGLKDLCITINNMVQGIDEKQISDIMKKALDPKKADALDKEVQKIVDKKETHKKGNTIKTLEKMNDYIK